MFGPVRFADDFRIRFNNEQYELLNKIDVVLHINIQWLRQLGHVVRMEENAPPDGFLMRKSAEVGKGDDLVSLGRKKIEEAMSSFDVSKWK